MKLLLSFLNIVLLTSNSVQSFAAGNNNPASVAYVDQVIAAAVNKTLQYAIGSTGDTGATGAVGASGATGTTGTSGVNVTTGYTGQTGNTGGTGPVGGTGSTGGVGSAGSIGASGQSGTSGTNGVQGTAGATGSTGAVTTYSVGQALGGGIVYSVDTTGTHGLIVSCQYADPSTGSAWLANYEWVSNVTSSGIGAGFANSVRIAAVEQLTTNSILIAAQLALQASYTANGSACTLPQGTMNPNVSTSSQPCFSNYYLPSLQEAQILSGVSTTIDGLSSNPCATYAALGSTIIWTSNEVSVATTTVAGNAPQAYTVTMGSSSPYTPSSPFKCCYSTPCNTNGLGGCTYTGTQTSIRTRPIAAF